MKYSDYNFLIVEDELVFRRQLADKLKSYGEVTTTDSFESGQKLIQNKIFDFAFLDLNLCGKLYGIKLAELAKNRSIKNIIILTNYDDDSDRPPIFRSKT